MNEPTPPNALSDLVHREAILQAWQHLSTPQQASLALMLMERALATAEATWLVETLWLRLTTLFETSDPN